jgi:hypothetical protein
MKLVRFALCAIVVSSLFGCQNASSPESVVNAYLETVKSGQSEKQKEFGCHANESPKVEQPLQAVEKWEVIGKETKTDGRDSEAKYHLVAVKIQEKSIGGVTVDHTWKFKVWNSNELFESDKRTWDNFNRKGAQVMESVRQIQQAVGDTPTAKSHPIVSKREEFSSNPFCVLTYEPVN